MSGFEGSSILGISAGGYHAEVTNSGAGIVSLTHKGRHLVLPPAAPSDGAAAFDLAGKTLVPWPNRVAGGTYVFDGVRHQLPINNTAHMSADHGLLAWALWYVTERRADTLTLETEVCPQPGYPFHLRATANFLLDAEAGLRVIVSVQNVGDEAAPVGIGSHPYLTCNLASIDNCLLLLPASQVLLTDQNLTPTSVVAVDGSNADFRTSTIIGDRQLDNAFAGLPPQQWQLDLTSGDTGMIVRLTSDSKWVQLFTAEHRGRVGLAAEPMTCPPNAFNSGTDLFRLEPGRIAALSYSIREV